MAAPASHPLTLALVDDYDVVLSGLAKMLDPYSDRVRVVELDANEPVGCDVDIVLYDSFAQPESDHREVGLLVANSHARKVVIYTWNFQRGLLDAAGDLGVDGCRPRRCPPATSWPRSRGSTPGSAWSVRHPPGPVPRPGWTGPVAAKA